MFPLKPAVVLFSFLSCTQAIPYEDCGTQGIIFSVDIDDCPDSPCVVDHGDSVHGEITFESGFDGEYLDCEIFGVIGGEDAPFPGSCTASGDVCLDLLEGDCPIEAGEMVLYEINMDVLPSYPSIKGGAKWTLLDQEENMVLCFTIDIEITAN